jgi:dCTP deaminase
MVLSQPELRKAVADREIKFDPPLEEKQWGGASIDLRLGYQFTKLKAMSGVRLCIAEGVKALSGFWDTADLTEPDAFGKPRVFTVEPGEFVLAMTYESITVPNNLIALVEGRSTYARFGLSMHQTAPWIQPGWSGSIVLEIMNNGPVKIDLKPLVDRPCQLTFFKLTSALPPELAYGARTPDSYKDQAHPLDRSKKKRILAATSTTQPHLTNTKRLTKRSHNRRKKKR